MRLTVGPDRGKYLHRVVMARMAQESCYYPLEEHSGLPSGMTVDHVDHKRAHNCGDNLLLLDIQIHNWLSWKSWLNKDKVGPPPSQAHTLGPDDFDREEAGIGRRYTQDEIAEVPW